MDANELTSRVSNLEHKVDNVLDEIRDDIRELKITTNSYITATNLKHEYTKEALDRAFTRIEKLEVAKVIVDTHMSEVNGFKKAVAAIFAILSTGVGYTLLELVVNNNPIK